MLQIDGICAGYGDLQVLFDVSLQVETGECVALVGSNGVGKTTSVSYTHLCSSAKVASLTDCADNTSSAVNFWQGKEKPKEKEGKRSK